MSAEQEAQQSMKKLGCPKVKFTGREPYKGKERLLFTMPNGDPVTDAPIIVVGADGKVELRPWTDQFR